MEDFLGKVTQQAMNYAIRSGIGITASFAIQQSAKLLKDTPKSAETDTLAGLQRRLDDKIRIITPAIDMIELIAARGNTSLESAVVLTKDLRLDIQTLGQRIASLNEASAAAKSARFNSQVKMKNDLELKLVIGDMRRFLERIEDAVPLINLAITTSGASLSTKLPATVSPSRLLQASAFLTTGDTQYSMTPHKAVQVGPTFNLSIYMLFAGHNRPETEEDMRGTTWKEVIHKGRVKLRRVPMDVVAETGSGSDALPSAYISSSTTAPEFPAFKIPAEARSDEFGYQIMIIEDFDDDRVHDFEDSTEKPRPFDDVAKAGIREMIPIHEVSRIFYADTSKVLNIGTDAEANHPVLLLRRDVNAVPPRKMMERQMQEQETLQPNDSGRSPEMQREHTEEDRNNRRDDPWRLPKSIDPEWIALEVYAESEDRDDDSEVEPDSSQNIDEGELNNSLASLHLNGDVDSSQELSRSQMARTEPAPWANSIKTSLSLLELLIRLTSLQQFQQKSHLAINDELLNFFLEESSSTGAGGDEAYRQALRAGARKRVGFDPYNESPVKKHGEDYQYQVASNTPSPRYYRSVEESQEWNPSEFQTRSITGVSDVESPPVSRSPRDRAGWMRSDVGQRGSPLRPQTADTDEGIGTSPKSPEF